MSYLIGQPAVNQPVNQILPTIPIWGTSAVAEHSSDELKVPGSMPRMAKLTLTKIF